MQKTTRINLALSAFIIFILIYLDQVLKSAATKWLLGRRPIVFLDGIVQFEYAENRGAFLSLGATLSDDQRFWIFVFGVFLVLLFCFYSLVKSIQDRYSVVALSFVITGGIGNLIDRAARGFVIDYVHMGFGGLRTGVLNLADVAISAGVLMLLFQEFVRNNDKPKKAN